MAALRQEHHYGLSSGKNNKNSSNRTLYHVKLTDTAIRALEAYQNLKVPFPHVCICVCLCLCVCLRARALGGESSLVKVVALSLFVFFLLKHCVTVAFC